MILSILSINTDTNKISSESYSLSSFSFLTRSSIKEMIQLFSLTITKRCTDQSFQEFNQSFGTTTYKFFKRTYDSHAYVMCTAGEYPASVALLCLKEAVHRNLGTVMGEYQDYRSKDVLMVVSEELEETKMVLNKTLDSILERGEKIEDLVMSAEVLSRSTKQLFRMSKKQNKCCSLW